MGQWIKKEGRAEKMLLIKLIDSGNFVFGAHRKLRMIYYVGW